MNRQQLAGVLGVSILLCGMARAEHIVTFAAPGAGSGSGQGTFVAGITDAGLVAGIVVDSNNVSHGYLRSPEGKFEVFDPPGTAYLSGGGTTLIGVNEKGAAVGYYIDATETIRAFLRSPDGKYTTFEAPGACPGNLPDGCHGSGAWNINASGVAVGPYEDTSGNFVAHTFIRTPDGKFTTFEVPGSSMEAGQGTLPASFSGLNQFGAITGLYYDSNNTFHGYLRHPNGTFVDFEAPGADLITPYNGTFPSSLNNAGTITGYYVDSEHVYRGFLRETDGKMSTFDAPGADTTADAYHGTFPESINFAGAVTGYVIDEQHVVRGWIREKDGGFTEFDAPGADLKPGDYNGTFPVSNNANGAVTGNYLDAKGVAYGFVRYPE